MKNRLLLLVLASAAAISGCVTTAGYRGHGGGHYGSSDYRYSRSYPYGYYDSDRYYYGYDRYGYDRYGYDRYGRSNGYPYGYAPYYNNNRYYYYYPTPQRPPTTGTNNPPPQPDPRLDPRSAQFGVGRMQPMDDRRDSELLRDLSHYRGVRQAARVHDEQDRPGSMQPLLESPRRMRSMGQRPMPMPSRAPASAIEAPASNPASVLESMR